MAKRIEFLDGVKGFGILSIILGHVFIPGWNDFLFLYHLPIFFLLAGYFINTRRSVGAFAKQRARRLLVPYAFTAVLITAFSVVKSLVEKTSIAEGLKKWSLAAVSGVGVEPEVPLHMESIGAIWFLWALFWASLLLRVLLMTDLRYFRLAAVLALFLTAVISVKSVFLPLSLQPGLAALLWVYVGWAVRQGKDWLEEQVASRNEVGEAVLTYGPAAMGVLFLVSLAVYLQAAFHYEPFLMVSASFDGGLLGLAGSFAGSFVVFAVLWALYRWKDTAARPVCAALTWLGQNSLALLCAHIIEQDLIPWKPLYTEAGLAGPGFFAAVFFSKLAFTLVVGFLFTKLPGIRKVF